MSTGRHCWRRVLLWGGRSLLPLLAAGLLAIPVHGQDPPVASAATDSPPPAMSSSAPAAQTLYAAFRPLLRQELESRDVSCPQDLYKFLFQGAMGPAHAVNDTMATDWLAREWRELPAASGDDSVGAASTTATTIPLLESLRPDGQLVRVNLWPLRELVRRGVPPARWDGVETAARERLALAFARTAERWRPELLELRTVWACAVADSTLWSDHFDAARLAEFTRLVEDAEWPAVHHCDEYLAAWAPHYRVVALELLPPVWRGEAQAPGEAAAADPGDDQ